MRVFILILLLVCPCIASNEPEGTETEVKKIGGGHTAPTKKDKGLGRIPSPNSASAQEEMVAALGGEDRFEKVKQLLDATAKIEKKDQPAFLLNGNKETAGLLKILVDPAQDMAVISQAAEKLYSVQSSANESFKKVLNLLAQDPLALEKEKESSGELAQFIQRNKYKEYGFILGVSEKKAKELFDKITTLSAKSDEKSQKELGKILATYVETRFNSQNKVTQELLARLPKVEGEMAFRSALLSALQWSTETRREETGLRSKFNEAFFGEVKEKGETFWDLVGKAQKEDATSKESREELLERFGANIPSFIRTLTEQASNPQLTEEERNNAKQMLKEVLFAVSEKKDQKLVLNLSGNPIHFTEEDPTTNEDLKKLTAYTPTPHTGRYVPEKEPEIFKTTLTAPVSSSIERELSRFYNHFPESAQKEILDMAEGSLSEKAYLEKAQDLINANKEKFSNLQRLHHLARTLPRSEQFNALLEPEIQKAQKAYLESALKSMSEEQRTAAKNFLNLQELSQENLAQMIKLFSLSREDERKFFSALAHSDIKRDSPILVSMVHIEEKLVDDLKKTGANLVKQSKLSEEEKKALENPEILKFIGAVRFFPKESLPFESSREIFRVKQDVWDGPKVLNLLKEEGFFDDADVKAILGS